MIDPFIPHSREHGSLFFAALSTATAAIAAVGVARLNRDAKSTFTIVRTTSGLHAATSRSLARHVDEGKLNSLKESERSPYKAAREQFSRRIEEARRYRKAQAGAAARSRWLGNILLILNYVLGGVLASSFVQQTVNPRWSGALGVLVLVSSLIRQQFQTDADRLDSERKVAELSMLIRPAEDRVVVLDSLTASGLEQLDELVGLTQWITQRLGEIEAGRETFPLPAKAPNQA